MIVLSFKIRYMRTLFFSLLLILASVSYSQSYKNVGAEEFKSLLDKKEGILLDTRTKQEYERGHIANAHLIDLRDQNVKNELLSLPKDKTLYLYCYSGARSRSVAAFLSQNGYTSIINLTRGIIDWNSKSYPLEKVSAHTATKQKDQYSIEEFNNTIKSDVLVFVDFYAEWCAPCKQMMPMIDALKNEYNGKVKIVKVNSEASAELVKHLSVASVPYLVLYKNGQQVYSKSGKATKEELQNVFDTNLK